MKKATAKVAVAQPVRRFAGLSAYLINREPPPLPLWHMQGTQTSMAPRVMPVSICVLMAAAWFINRPNAGAARLVPSNGTVFGFPVNPIHKIITRRGAARPDLRSPHASPLRPPGRRGGRAARDFHSFCSHYRLAGAERNCRTTQNCTDGPDRAGCGDCGNGRVTKGNTWLRHATSTRS